MRWIPSGGRQGLPLGPVFQMNRPLLDLDGHMITRHDVVEFLRRANNSSDTHDIVFVLTTEDGRTFGDMVEVIKELDTASRVIGRLTKPVIVYIVVRDLPERVDSWDEASPP